MGFWSSLFGQRSSLPAGVEKRDDHVGPSFDLSDAALAAYIRVGASGIGEIDSWAALQQPAYWRATNLLAGIVATLPLKAYRTDPKNDERTVVSSYLDNPAGPYPLTPFDWKHLVMMHLLLHGEADLMFVRNNAGQLIGLWPLHPTSVQVFWSESGSGGKRFLVSVAGGKTLDSEKGEIEVLQILGTTLDGLRGVNPLVLHRKPIQTMQAQEQSANRIATNGLQLAGLVAADQEDIDEDDAKIIKAGLDEKVGGPTNAGGIAFVNKRLKFTPWTMNGQEAQLLQSREYSVDEVGRMFGIPAHLLGSQAKATSWGTGILEMNLALQKFTLMPWTSRIEEALSTTLPAPRHAEFLYKGLFQGTPQQEIELLLAQTGGAPILTVNEARGVLNLAPIKGGDVLAVPAAASPSATPSVNPDQGAGRSADLSGVEQFGNLVPNSITSLVSKAIENQGVKFAALMTEEETVNNEQFEKLLAKTDEHNANLVTAVATAIAKIEVRSSDVKVVSAPSVNVAAPNVTVHVPKSPSKKLNVIRDKMTGQVSRVEESE